MPKPGLRREEVFLRQFRGVRQILRLPPAFASAHETPSK